MMYYTLIPQQVTRFDNANKNNSAGALRFLLHWAHSHLRDYIVRKLNRG